MYPWSESKETRETRFIDDRSRRSGRKLPSIRPQATLHHRREPGACSTRRLGWETRRLAHAGPMQALTVEPARKIPGRVISECVTRQRRDPVDDIFSFAPTNPAWYDTL